MQHPIKIRTKTAFLEAMQFTNKTWEDVANWCGGDIFSDPMLPPDIGCYMEITTEDCTILVFDCEWVIKDAKGKFGVFSDDVFKASYEKITDIPEPLPFLEPEPSDWKGWFK